VGERIRSEGSRGRCRGGREAPGPPVGPLLLSPGHGGGVQRAGAAQWGAAQRDGSAGAGFAPQVLGCPAPALASFPGRRAAGPGPPLLGVPGSPFWLLPGGVRTPARADASGEPRRRLSGRPASSPGAVTPSPRCWICLSCPSAPSWAAWGSSAWPSSAPGASTGAVASPWMVVSGPSTGTRC